MADPTRFVGVPFAYGGRGPDTFDCYGLLMAIHADQGIQLPDYESSSNQSLIAAMMGSGLPLWEPCERGPGASVLLRLGRLASHCGYMLDHRRMIHTWESTGGVIIQNIDAWENRVMGFYRYVGRR